MRTYQSLFAGVVTSPETSRTLKPRKKGITMVIDKGLGVEATRDLLRMAADHIDFWKLGFGTPLVYSKRELLRKIRIVKEHQIDIYPGGTLLEIAVWQGKGSEFIARAADLGFTAIEVSEGTIDLNPRDRQRLIGEAVRRGLRVLSELGKKDSAKDLNVEDVPRLVRMDLEHGAEWVIIEGRDSGVGVGVYDEAGRARSELFETIVAGVDEPDRLIWEAPQVKQQQEWLLRFGPNVNLGNIQPQDVISLEAMRQGLRGDTLRQHIPKALVFGTG